MLCMFCKASSLLLLPPGEKKTLEENESAHIVPRHNPVYEKGHVWH